MSDRPPASDDVGGPRSGRFAAPRAGVADPTPARLVPASVPSERRLVAVDARPADVLRALEAALAGGPAVLPVDPALPRTARRTLLDAVRPTAETAGDGTEVARHDGVPVGPATLVVLATSGSTGAPRGVALSGAALGWSVGAGLEAVGADPDVPWVCCLPTAHVAGVLVLLRGVATGTPAVLLERFDPVVVASLRERVHLAVVPTMLRRLLDAGADPRRWDVVLLGGAAAPAALVDEARDRGARIVTTYGMTESTGGCVYDGRPLRGVEVRTDPPTDHGRSTGDGADLGRIALRGPVLAEGYRTRGGLEPLPGPGDGWFRTADVGRWDAASGRLSVGGRADDIIVSGGTNVPATAVAALLEELPNVAEAAVVGVADVHWGERVVAVVVPRDAARPPALQDLRDAVVRRAPAAWAPRGIIVVGALPHLPNGKLDRGAVRRTATG